MRDASLQSAQDSVNRRLAEESPESALARYLEHTGKSTVCRDRHPTWSEQMTWLKQHWLKAIIIAGVFIVVGGLIGLPTGYGWAKRKLAAAKLKAAA